MTAPAVPALASQERSRMELIAASIGGVATLGVVLAGLPPTLGAAVLVVQHLAVGIRSRMDEVLGARTDLPVQIARDAETPLPGRVFIAPPGRHLVIAASGALALSDLAPVSFVRPSA